jgi:hypothetical protein
VVATKLAADGDVGFGLRRYHDRKGHRPDSKARMIPDHRGINRRTKTPDFVDYSWSGFKGEPNSDSQVMTMGIQVLAPLDGFGSGPMLHTHLWL